MSAARDPLARQDFENFKIISIFFSVKVYHCTTMGKSKTRAQQFAEAQGTVVKGNHQLTTLFSKSHLLIHPDFDPEEDGPAQQSDEESSSRDSSDDLAGTE